MLTGTSPTGTPAGSASLKRNPAKDRKPVPVGSARRGKTKHPGRMRPVEEMLGSPGTEADCEERRDNLPPAEYYMSYDGQGHDPSAEVSYPPYQAEERLDEIIINERPAGEAAGEHPYAALKMVCPLPILPDLIIEDLMAWKTQDLCQYIHDRMPQSL